MKKLILVGLLALSSIAAVAASVKTSKAIPLSTSQMEAIKGQGTVTVWVWTEAPPGSGYFYYRLASVNDTGPYGPTFSVYVYGPLAGTH